MSRDAPSRVCFASADLQLIIISMTKKYDDYIDREFSKLISGDDYLEADYILDVARTKLHELQSLDSTIEAMTLLFNSKALGKVHVRIQTDRTIDRAHDITTVPS